MPLEFQYERCVRQIYFGDLCSYHIMTYLVYGGAWEKLPDFAWNSPFWILSLVSMLLWTAMVFVRAKAGSKAWDRVPTDAELCLWLAGCFLLHPVFFFALARLSEMWNWYIVIIVYRVWSSRQMGNFLQEVREKGFLLEIQRANRRN